jgi:hypothetical protein
MVSADDEEQKAAIELFEKKIRPVLVERCYECHSHQKASDEGGLRLDTADATKRGGSSGPAIIPGDSERSLLIRAISYSDEKLKMPPDQPLAEEVVRDFRRWIEIGAVDPRKESLDSPMPTRPLDAKQQWAFHVPQPQDVPEVQDDRWPNNDLDCFLLAKLDESGMQPLGSVDRYTWLRRVTFALTGLPPTMEEISDFINNLQQDAYETVVDRLLASPRYGEHWARHWFDVIHYSDTTGCNSDFPVPQMVRYRDWVVRAFNEDMPYDRFVRAQLAGDIVAASLPDPTSQAERNAWTIATGFIANARRFGSRHGDYPQHLTIEDTIDTLGKSFLGMSLACARCHDHKFDPISQQDYYSLYGYFHNTQYPWPGIETQPIPKDFVPLIEKDRFEAANEAKQARQRTLDKEVKRIDQLRRDTKDETRAELDRQFAEAKQIADAHAKRPLGIDFAYAVTDKVTCEKVRVQYKGDPNKPGPEVPIGTPSALGGSVSDCVVGSGRLHLADWIASNNNPLTARVLVNRVWKYHFGVGIVPTPNDFGKQGKAPSHPELLDDLASRWMDSGWSVKQLQRRIVLSKIYQTRSVGDPSLESIDPNNVLLRGFRRQRLDAESIRDSLLAMAGALDLKQGEPHPFPKQQDWKFTQHNPFKAVYETNLRSVYLMTQRIQRHPYLGIFDGADPSTSTPARNVSTTPLQALYLLNDEIVHRMAEKFAARVQSWSDDSRGRIQFLFHSALGRPARDDDVILLEEFLASYGDGGSSPQGENAWSAVARSLIRSNEFVYVD